MAEKDLGRPIPEIRISFEIPASFFRMRYTEKRQSVNSFRPHPVFGFPSKVWDYEVDLTVPECSEYAGMPVGIWTFAISRTMEYSATSTQYLEKEVSVSLHPQSSISNNWTNTAPDSRVFKVTFFVGILPIYRFSPGQPSSFVMWKGKGNFQDNKWTCNPTRCAFSTSASAPQRFLDDNSMAKGTTWSLDMLFHITIPSKSTVDKLSGLADKFGNLLKLATFSDCTLISADGKEFPAHRAILSAQSPVFAAMFVNNMTEKSTGICKIVDVSGDLLEAVLEFLYGRTVNEELKLRVEDGLVAAHRYDMDDLQNVCEDVMIGGLNKENAVRYLGLAITYGLHKLMKRAAKFVAE